MTALNQILTNVLSGQSMKRPLSGGLYLQYKEPDASNPAHRLFCYRRGSISPSMTEFGVIRRELEALLPPGKKIALGNCLSYQASDNENRTGRVFSWAADAEQAAFDLDVETPVRYE